MVGMYRVICEKVAPHICIITLYNFAHDSFPSKFHFTFLTVCTGPPFSVSEKICGVTVHLWVFSLFCP